MLQKLSVNKNNEIEGKKKTRQLVFLIFSLTIFLSLVFWTKSGNLKLQLPSLSLPGPSLLEKVYVFEKKEALTEEKEELRPFKSPEILKTQILEIIKGKKGNYGIWFKNLVDGSSFGIDEDKVFQAASVNKVPVMIAFYQAVEEGKIDKDQVYVLQDQDKQSGTGSLQSQTAGKSYSYEELVRLAGKESDNTAINVLIRIVGMLEIGELLTSAGLKVTSIEKSLTTPYETSRLFEQVYDNRLLEKEHREKFFDFLTDTLFEERIPAGVPQEIRVAHKIGNNSGVYNDCGIVFAKTPYSLCVLSNNVIQSEAEEVLPQISKKTWEFIDQ